MNRRDSKTEIVIKLPRMYSLAVPKTKVCPGIRSQNIPLTPPKQTKHIFQSNVFVTQMNIDDSNCTSSTFMSTNLTHAVAEIHLTRLFFNANGVRVSKSKLESGSVLKLKWTFYNFSTSSTIGFKPEEGNIAIGMTILYRVELNNNFYSYLDNKSLNIELIGEHEGIITNLASGKMSFANLLNQPNTRFSYDIDIIDADEGEILGNMSAVTYFGRLSMWIQLSCLDSQVRSLQLRSVITNIHLKKDRKKSGAKTRLSHYLKDSYSANDTNIKDEEMETNDVINSSSSSSETDSDIEEFQDALDLILTRNKALKITQSDIANELKERSKWLHEEYNWKRTLQEYNILCGNDPHLVNWRQWRNSFTSSVRLRRFSSMDGILDTTLSINIHKMEFSQFFADWRMFPEIDMIYVKLKFFHFQGDDMTTKSVPINKRAFTCQIYFDFSKSFDISLKNNGDVCEKLAYSIKEKKHIEFAVFSEPFEDLTKIQCAFEIASSKIELFDLVQLFDNIVVKEINVQQIQTGTSIGKLTISIEGIQAMRAVALQILSPPDFK